MPSISRPFRLLTSMVGSHCFSLLSASHAYALSLSPLSPWFAAPTIFSGSVDGRMRPHRATRPSDRLIHERAGKARSQNVQAGWHEGNQKDERELNNTAGKQRRGRERLRENTRE